SPLPVPEREEEARRRARELAARPFSLERGPLVRACLLRLSEAEHWLAVTLHHIATDGWSSGVMHRGLSVLYEALGDGPTPSLPELPVQYADYALWQREQMQGKVLEEQLAYWKKALAELPVLELPTDRTRPAASSYRGARITFELGADLTRRLTGL